MERGTMKKAPKLITLSAFGLIGSPFLTAVTCVLNLIPFIGTVVWVAILIHFAHCVEDERLEYFPDTNIAVFTACAYAPGLAASFIFCAVMSNVTANDYGYGGLVGGLFGYIVLGSQIVFAFIGSMFSLYSALKAPKKSKLPKLPYCPDRIDPDEFFNGKGE